MDRTVVSSKLGLGLVVIAVILAIVFSIVIYQDVLAVEGSGAPGVLGIGSPALESVGFLAGVLLIVASVLIGRGDRLDDV